MTAKKEPLKVTVTVQAPLRGAVSVTVKTTVPVGEPVGRSDAVAMMRREARDAVDLMDRATAAVRGCFAADQESDLAEMSAPPRWTVEVYTSSESEEACQSTKRLLKQLGVAYTEIDLARANVLQMMKPVSLGITLRPAVLLRDLESNAVKFAWGGHRPDLIMEHFASRARRPGSDTDVAGRAEGGDQ